MVNPKQAHNYAKAMGQRGKSDIADAKMLSHCIELAKKSDIRVPVINLVEQALKELIGYYKFTTKQRVQTVNHLESIHVNKGSSYTKKNSKKR